MRTKEGTIKSKGKVEWEKTRYWTSGLQFATKSNIGNIFSCPERPLKRKKKIA